MKKKKVFYFLILTTFFYFFSYNKICSQKIDDIFQIHELKEMKPTSGTYKIEGFVVKKYICPECPQGAMCKPCMKEHIIISENQEFFNNYNLSNRDLIIFVKNPEMFELGKKYKFTVRITDNDSTLESLNDIEIIN